MGSDIAPITTGNIGEDSALNTYNAAANPATDPADMKPLFYKNPIRSFEANVPYSGDSWLKADKAMYVQIPLEIAFIEYDGKTPEGSNVDKEYLAKDVYISDLLIQEDYQNKVSPNSFKDLSSAVRVHISYSYKE